MKKFFFIFLTFFSMHVSGESKQWFILTIPKAGTALSAKAVSLLTGHKIGGLNHFLFTESFLLENPNIKTSVHLVKNFDPLLDNKNVKKILIIRDLRDVCISAVYWLRKNDWFSYAIDHTAFYYMNNFDDQLSYMINLDHQEYSIKGFAQRAIRWMNSPDVLTIRFEDLVGENGGGTREAQIEALRTIAKHLEVNVSEEKIANVADNLWGESATFRNGKINNWKTNFTEENKILFQEVLGEESRELGYCDFECYWGEPFCDLSWLFNKKN